MIGRSRFSGRPSFSRQPPSPFSRPSSSSPSMFDEPVKVTRRLPVTPIYEGGDPFALSMTQFQPPKQVRDKLYDRMCDWQYHTVVEMERWLPGNLWIKGMMDLLVFGFTFDKATINSDRGIIGYRLRKREFREEVPLVVTLLSGVTLPEYIEVSITRETGLVAVPEQPEQGVQPFTDANQWPDPPPTERMILDEKGEIVLSILDMVTDTVGILARRGAGKTYLAMVLAEEFLASTLGIPFVVLDPTGVWWGLLADMDGQPSTSRVVVFGGKHGHYPLNIDDGRVLAQLVVSCRPLPVILDLSEFASEDQHEFCADFAAELYLINHEPLHIFLDEADVFAPQRLDKSSRHQRRVLAEIDTLVRRGRIRGLGITMITQRPAVINKNVLSQVGSMFFLQTIAPHDLKAIEEWMLEQIKGNARKECRAELPVLGRGEVYYMRGGEQYRFCRFKVRGKTTFDSSITPRHGEKPRSAELYQLEPADRETIEACLAKTLAGEVGGENGDGDNEGRFDDAGMDKSDETHADAVGSGSDDSVHGADDLPADAESVADVSLESLAETCRNDIHGSSAGKAEFESELEPLTDTSVADVRDDSDDLDRYSSDYADDDTPDLDADDVAPDLDADED